MPQMYVIFETKLNHLLCFECSNIVSDQLPRNSKPLQDVLLQRLNNFYLSGMSSWDGINPFGEIISGSENPIVLP